MQCEDIDLLLIEYHNGELSQDMARRMEEHLENCVQCRELREKTGEVITALQNVSADIPVDVKHKDKLRESLLQELRIYRATSPFLSGLYRREEKKREGTTG